MNRRLSRSIIGTLLLIIFGGMIFTSQPALAAAYIVTNLNDSGTGSLRQAIIDTNANPGADIITFSLSGTIILASKLPHVNDNLTIDGTGQNVILSGNNAFRVLAVKTTAMTLEHITIINGYSPDNDDISSDGTGMYVFGSTITINNSTFLNNEGSSLQLFVGAMVTINNSTFSNNLGSSIDSFGGNVTINNSTFSGHSESAIVAFGIPLRNNEDGSVTLGGYVTVNNSTFSDNLNGAFSGFHYTINGSIISGTCTDPQYPTTTIIGSNNIMWPAACGDATGVVANPLLAPLADNGGTTRTHALQAGSPAINALTTSCPSFDQRGIARPVGNACDIGSVEDNTLALTSPINVINDAYGNPTYVWNDIGADTYEFYLDNNANDDTALYYVAGLTDDDYCDTGVCEFDPTQTSEAARLPTNGDYVVYLRGTTGGIVGSVAGPFAFTLNAPAPAPVTMGTTTGLATLRPTANWTLNGNSNFTTWFRIYLIRKDFFDAGNYAPTADFWLSRVQGCGSTVSTTCALQSGLDLLDNTAYYVYIQSYAPGGYSVGGDYGNGWAGTEFTVNIPKPAVPSNVTVTPNQGRPTISWTGDALANQYYVYLRNQENGATAYYQAHPSNTVCSGVTCSLTDVNMILANGTYEAYVYTCLNTVCSVGGPYNNGWGGTAPNNVVTYNLAPPALVTNLLATYGTSPNGFTVTFDGKTGATWYQIWVGTAGAAQTYHFQWVPSSAGGATCVNAGACSFFVNQTFPAGALYVAVQSAGPGGWLTTTGPASNGFEVSGEIIIP